MILSFHESLAPDSFVNSYVGRSSGSITDPWIDREMEESQTVPWPPPDRAPSIKRRRVWSLLDRSVERFPATLVQARAGHGKTFEIMQYVETCPDTTWMSLNPTDSSWEKLAHRLSCHILDRSHGKDAEELASFAKEANTPNIARLFVDFLDACCEHNMGGKGLLVLDNFHNLYDAEWFVEMFKVLLSAAPKELHLIVISRSSPPGPLFRLRSKQVLNLIDENSIAFDVNETHELFREIGVPLALAETINQRAFGNISKILDEARPFIAE
ncbi:MAG TPA: hypothetical protein PKA82_08045 [Pyrinomonadaceae bacterium]|nr:hypothetical protein [Pyrinomonadaceae bacterium]